MKKGHSKHVFSYIARDLLQKTDTTQINRAAVHVKSNALQFIFQRNPSVTILAQVVPFWLKSSGASFICHNRSGETISSCQHFCVQEHGSNIDEEKLYSARSDDEQTPTANSEEVTCSTANSEGKTAGRVFGVPKRHSGATHVAHPDSREHSVLSFKDLQASIFVC
eukprot:4725447-Amphidinium_carterae.1